MYKLHRLIISIIFLTGISSCKKIVSTFFKGEDFTLSKITVSIPPIPVADSSKEFEAGSFTTHFNVDSAIRDHTGGVFGIGVVEYIKVKSVSVVAHNVDDKNNLSALKSFRLTIVSDAKTTASNMLTVNFPATVTDGYTETFSNSANIVDYMRGTSFTNHAYGTVRRPTTKNIKIDFYITLTAR
ncbi:MAG TPA: hypothetical protein VHB48_03025 [Chitinophagaceae bacterium]|nr:hypothetical protein [Chitinophagaceae bacterium]